MSFGETDFTWNKLRAGSICNKIFSLCSKYYYESIHKPCFYSQPQSLSGSGLFFKGLCTIRIFEQTEISHACFQKAKNSKLAFRIQQKLINMLHRKKFPPAPKDDYQLKALKMLKSIKGSNQCLKSHCTIKETKKYHGKYVNY